MADVLAGVGPGDGAAPTLRHPDYTLVASAESGFDVVIAEWTGHWGPPGGYLGADSIEVTVRRFRDPIDIDLRVGVWNDALVSGDRTIYRNIMGFNPTWYPVPDVEVSVRGSGTIDANQAISTLESVDEAAFSAAAAGIEEAADLAPVIGETVRFDSGAWVDVIGALGDARGVCLTRDETRRCDLALLAHAGYTEANELVFFDTDLLVDGRWFTTGVRIDRGDESFRPPIPAGAETVQGDDRTYYLIEHPADALVVTDSYDNPTMRPAR